MLAQGVDDHALLILLLHGPQPKPGDLEDLLLGEVLGGPSPMDYLGLEGHQQRKGGEHYGKHLEELDEVHILQVYPYHAEQRQVVEGYQVAIAPVGVGQPHDDRRQEHQRDGEEVLPLVLHPVTQVVDLGLVVEIRDLPADPLLLGGFHAGLPVLRQDGTVVVEVLGAP
jgi:hypothetical protein